MNLSLHQLGWKAFFQQQLTLEDLENYHVFRVINQQRSGYLVCSDNQTLHLNINQDNADLSVGDWLLLDSDHQWVKTLDRTSLFARKAIGNERARQAIAANVDTVFIVCSLNDDFNLNRIERYLALAYEAQVTPVVVLTKADLCADVEHKQALVQALDAHLSVFAVNGLDINTVETLLPWCKCGETIALLGSSGVGKSTLLNTLLQQEVQQTGEIREQDSKGRHTTTARSLYPMASGALLLDTPGMRELQLVDCEQGLTQTFADVSELIEQCRFSDCQHQTEPGCAVRNALESGQLEQRRLDNFLKLQREQARNSASLAQKHEHARNLGKMYRRVQSEASLRKKGY